VQIISFFTNKEFQEIIIEGEDKDSKHKKGESIEKLKIHTMPKGFVNLENIFDLQEKFNGPENVNTGSSSHA
jgi:hypothetical protein